MSTPQSNEKQLCPAWPPQTIFERLKTCRIMLYQHGFITDAECARIDKRIDKREAQAALKEVQP